VITLAGSAGEPGSVDGTGSAARFRNPLGIAVDGVGNVYVSDSGNSTIRKIAPDATVTTLAGLAGSPGTGDGDGRNARFKSPNGLAVDRAGNVFVADGASLRRIAPDGSVITPANWVDETGHAARFTSLSKVAVDRAGNLFVTDTEIVEDDGLFPASSTTVVRKIAPNGKVSTLPVPYYPTPSGVSFSNYDLLRSGVAVDGEGNLFITEHTGTSTTLRRIATDGSVSTIAGSSLSRFGGSVFGSNDGDGSVAQFYNPSDIAVDGAGNLYVADTGNNTIRVGALEPVAPVITAQPQSQTVARGRPVAFNATASGTPAPSYQWTKDGITLPGATEATLIIIGATTADAGAYQCIVTNTAGSTTSTIATLTVVDAMAPGRFRNFSARASASSSRSIVVGFVVVGPRQKNVLIRGIGPTLASFGVSGALADPKLEIFSAAGQRLAENDNWQPGLASVFTSAGAFALSADSKDAALLLPLQPGAYTAVLSSADGGSGVGLIELYEVQ